MPEKLRSAAVLALRFLFLTRYSWLLALALVGLPPLALVAAPALLENLFVLDRPVQMLHVSWITMFCAASVIATLHITTLNAIDRFDDYRAACEAFAAAWQKGEHGDPRRRWYGGGETGVMVLLGLGASLGMWYVVLSACVARTSADMGDEWRELLQGNTDSNAIVAAAWRQALYGLGFALAALAAVYLLLLIRRMFCVRPIEEHGYEFGCTLTSRLSADVVISKQPCCELLAWLLGPGYLRTIAFRRGGQTVQQIVLAPGHAGLVLSTSLFFGWYGWNYVNGLRHGIVLDGSSPFSALFFGLLSLQLIILVLPGIAFFLDRHRLPILPALLLVMALLYRFFGTDHFYELNPDPPVAGIYQAPSWDQVLNDRLLPVDEDGKRTLVVVDASGGGIQASAWTAQVLTGLHELYGEPFSRSVGLISAVSGGSVGTVFYLSNRADIVDGFDPRTESVLPPDAIQRIRVAARASGLEATCWGIAYPDTMRAVFPPLADESIDRGWSVEQSWRERMGRPELRLDDLRLSQLGERIRGGTLPVPVFNATLVETGQRMLISPVLSPAPVGAQPSAGVEFLRCFPESHLRVSTAARLSATFPYVTPVARARPPAHQVASEPPHPVTRLHVADGAYADNEGAVTSVDWINRLMVHYSRPEHLDTRPFDRVLLIRIQAFPKELSRTVRATTSFSGWRAALLGPFDAMMHVRSASQTERGDLEIGLLTRATLAELKAAKERTDRDFQSALAQVDQLEAIRDELRRLAAAAPTGQADINRQFLETDDKLRFAREMLQRSQEQQRRLTELQVESVVFDFHPVEGVRVPMSWKLTNRQQRQIDETWSRLVNDQYPHQPLAIVDKYFERVRLRVARAHAQP